jgi:XTP/dITP diphosphohydrolase
MVKAMRLQEKAKQVGFEWDTRDQVWEKVNEEITELAEAVEARDNLDNEENTIKVEEELGDVFFSLVNYARFLRTDAEQALERTNKKFISRFMEMEAIAMRQGKDLQHMTLAEMDELWNIIKRPKV